MAGIYIHIPFCKQKCSYCDFHFSTTHTLMESMVSSIQSEIVLRKNELTDSQIEALYFGGGTPSLLSASEIEAIIDTVYRHYRVSSNAEITLEANPDDLSESYLQSLAKTRVNRLSVGIQSFREEDLRFMNRAHSAQEAKECLSRICNYFTHFSLDLIYGIPQLSPEAWLENIQTALSFKPHHISAYALTVSPNTLLEHEIKKGIRPPLDEEMAFLHFEALRNELSKEGYLHYEISNFCLPGKFAVNNTAYWQGKEYLGIGPSAHSFVNGVRSWNVSNNVKYLYALNENSLPSTCEKLTIWDQYNEFVMTGLRTMWGVSLEEVETKFGKEALLYLKGESEILLNNGSLVIDNKRLTISPMQLFYADGIAAQLFYV